MMPGLIFSLLNADKVNLNKSWNYKNVISPFYRLYLIDNGSGVLSNPDQSLILEKGFLYLIPSFTLVNHTCPSRLSQYYIHFIEDTPDGSSMFSHSRKLMKVKATRADLDCFRRLLWLNPGRDLRKSDNPQVYEKTSVLKSFREINAQLPLSTVIETQGLIQVLLSRFLSNELYHSGKNDPIPSAILESMSYILTHLATTITVEELAGHANLSTDYFSKSFCRHTGLRPLQYIHQKRIERARFLILTTHLSFTAIAAETGFESLSYFTRVFKATTGQAPGTYRKTHLHVM